MTGNAELQTSAFLKDCASKWRTLKVACFGRTVCFWVFLEGAGLNGRNLPLF